LVASLAARYFRVGTPASDRAPPPAERDETTPSSPLRRGLWLFQSQLLILVAATVTNVLSARMLQPSGRGTLAVALQVSYIGVAIVLAGVDRSYPVTAPISNLSAALPAVLRMLLWPAAGLFAVSIAAVLTLRSHHPGVTSYASVIALTTVALVGVTAVRVAAIASPEVVSFVKVTAGSQAILILLAVSLTVLRVHDPRWWLAAYGPAGLVPVAVLGRALRRRSPGNPLEPAVMRSVRVLGVRLLPACLGQIILLRADRLLLPMLSGAEALGIYVVVSTFTELLVWPVQNYVDGAMPVWRRLHNQGLLQTIRVGFVIGAYVGISAGILVWLGGRLLVPAFGTRYAPSRELLFPLSMGSAAYAMSRYYAGLALARGRARQLRIAEMVSVCVALSAYLLLIPSAGARGAAQATLIGYTTSLVLMLGAALTTPEWRRGHRAHDPRPEPTVPLARRGGA